MNPPRFTCVTHGWWLGVGPNAIGPTCLDCGLPLVRVTALNARQFDAHGRLKTGTPKLELVKGGKE